MQEKTILCIDDDPDFLNYLKLLLGSAGFNAIEAFSAGDGLKKFRETNPSLVIVDLMMEEIDAGLNLCSELRALRKDIPIFLISSVGERFAASIDTSLFGFDAVLQKPLDEDTLLSLIRSKIG